MGFIKNREGLVSHGDREGRALALDILEGGLAAADPYANTRDLIRMQAAGRTGSRLLVGGAPDRDVSGYGDEVIDLDEIEHVYVLGAGKAVQRQAQALEDLLGERLTDGAIVVKQGEGCCLRRIEVIEGAHPVPDEQSVAGAKKVVEIARRAGARDLVFTLFSDGASSLMTLPAPGLTLDDIRQVYFLAIKYGGQRVSHQAMPYLSAVKNGRLMRHVLPARSVNLIMQVGLFPRWHGVLNSGGSWVPSWPPPPRRMAEGARAIRRAPWWDEFPQPVREIFENVDLRYEVPALDAFRSMRASYWQPIDLYQMVEGARARAGALGLQGVILSSHLVSPSAPAANVLAHVAHECAAYGRPFKPPVALITGGHLDVPVGEATGIGGRNQEFALLWGKALGSGRLASKRVVVAAMDSDGTDGPGTQHAGSGEMLCMAGGIVDGHMLEEAAERGVDVVAELRNHNSTVALIELDSAIHTGNTGMALGDLRVAVVR